MEAVKQGSATVGLKSRTHAVLVALKVFNLIFALHNYKTDTDAPTLTAQHPYIDA